MKCERVFSVFLYLLIGLVAMQSVGCSNSQETKVEVGNKAPDFKLKSIAGEVVSLKDFRGKMVLLEFGASWCSYCMAKIPKLKEIHSNYSDEIAVVYIDIEESEAKVKALVNTYSMQYTVLLDEDGYAAKDYKVLGIPNILLIDKEGIILYRGYDLPENLEDFIT